MDRNGSDTERRLHAIEDAFQRERQQRDLLEKKYARLKRRYVRLERSHSRLLMESTGVRQSSKRFACSGDGRVSNDFLLMKNTNRVETSSVHVETLRSVESTRSLEPSTVHFLATLTGAPGPSAKRHVLLLVCSN